MGDRNGHQGRHNCRLRLKRDMMGGDTKGWAQAHAGHNWLVLG